MFTKIYHNENEEASISLEEHTYIQRTLIQNI